MESVETVTILITDLVGSTGLESRIGPAAAVELRGEHFGLLREVIAETGGRELKNTGDGLTAAFDSAAAAVSCAVLVQQRFERRNRSADERLLIKVGVSSGDASAVDGDYFGMPVIEAARLSDRCSGAQILAKELVAHLAGGRGHSFKSVGALELKGLPEPLDAVEVAWEPLGADAGAMPLPLRLQEIPAGGLVGRAAEIELLNELFDQTRAGDRRLALLSGEPGIGKTRLSTYTALAARARGATVLYGRCDEELGIPYGPWIEALSHYVEHAPEELLTAHIERHGPELARLVPGLAARLPGLAQPRESDPDTERYLLWGAVVGLLREASGAEPLVLVLDDLHWADKPTLLLLKYLLMEGGGVRALIIATYRDSDLHRGHPLTEVLADLHREQGVERLAISGLAQAEIVELMERASGHELDELAVALSRELFHETDGNPFYTGEILRNLLESGTIYQQENGHFTVRGHLSERGGLSDLTLPQSVREVVGRRVERLGQETADVLSVAAVIGREFDIDLLATVSERSEDELLELLEGAVASSVLAESARAPGRFSFAHALINHTLYEDLGTTRRARLHGRTAEALEALLGSEPGARVAELAHHWAAATTTVDWERAAGYALKAGQHGLSQLAPDEALRWFRQALDLIEAQADPAVAMRCDALIGLGESERQVGDADFRETLLTAARLALEAGDLERLTAAVLANNRGRTSVYGLVDSERVELIEAALERMTAEDLVSRARLLSLLALELAYQPDAPRRRALSDEALALAREASDPHALVQVLRDRAFCTWDPRDTEDRRRTISELLELSEASGDPVPRFWALSCDTELAACEGDMQRAGQRVEEAHKLAGELGQPTLLWAAIYHKASLLQQSDPEEADRLSTAAFEFGAASGEGDAVMVFGGQRSVSWFLRGDWELMLSTLVEAAAAFPRITAFDAGTAAARVQLGDVETAAGQLAKAMERDFDTASVDAIWTTTLHLWTIVAIRTGDREAAARLQELFEEVTDRAINNGASGYGAVDAYRALLAWELGRNEDAHALWKSGLALNEETGLPLANLYPLMLRGHQLASHGNTAEAAEIYRRARSLAETRDLSGTIELIDTALAPGSTARA